MAKKTSKKKLNENTIYSRLSYESSIIAKRNVLEMEARLLEILQNIQTYRELRKREIMWKIKLKKNLKEMKEKIADIMDEVPKTPGTKVIHEEHKEKERMNKKSPINTNIELELADIQRKLEEINKK